MQADKAKSCFEIRESLSCKPSDSVCSGNKISSKKCRQHITLFDFKSFKYPPALALASVETCSVDFANYKTFKIQLIKYNSVF